MNWRDIQQIDMRQREHYDYAKHVVDVIRDAATYLRPRASTAQCLDIDNLHIRGPWYDPITKESGDILELWYKKTKVLVFDPESGIFSMFQPGSWIDKVNALEPKIERARKVHQQGELAKKEKGEAQARMNFSRLAEQNPWWKIW